MDDELNIDESREECQRFQQYYREELFPWLKSQSDRQRQAVRWAVKTGIPGLGITGLSVWGLFVWCGSPSTWGSCVIMPAICLIVTLVVSFARLGAIRRNLREQLLPLVSEFFGLSYCAEKDGMDFGDFIESGLLPRHDRRDLTNYFQGNYQGIPMEFFECLLLKRVRIQDSDTHSTGYGSEAVHRCLLFRFTLPRVFAGRTLIFKDRGMIGNMVKDFSTRGQRIKLNDAQFEKRFEVWSSEPLEASALLTPVLAKNLVELAGKLGTDEFEACFQTSQLIVSMKITGDPFAVGGLGTSVTDKRPVERLVREICKAFDIVDAFQLGVGHG